MGFDLDDTLYDRGDYYRHIYELMEKTVVQAGVDFDEFYKVLQHYSDIEYEKFIRQGKGKDEYKIDRVTDTYKEFGQSIGKDEGIIFNALYLYYRDRIEYRTGAEELLNKLKQAGYELFVLTNGPSIDQRNKLSHLNINHYIPEDRWFISDELQSSKPDARTFKIVEETIGYSAGEILYIGDNYVNDIEGASQVGWQSILLDIHHHQGIASDTKVVQSLEEVLSIL
ncbi:HAD family hydrolase [Aerococcaceae bacterium WGS1372]